ncbi:hypothetical protein ACLOAU_10725 [Niabella sp. CJ426]|uniref:hypothetical protein n=1 Tax=Niabella sp. CJ426 TaxID=3393740 RepID=UPI003D08A5CA
MQWKTITSSLGNTAFSLWSNGRKLLTLAYQSQSDRVYIESEDGEKRHFRCRNKGLLKNRIVLENEYGTNLGKLKKEGSREFILIDGKKYYLNFLNNKEVEIIAEDAQEPLTVCSLDLENPTTEAKKGLLIVLCYYLLGHPQKREQPAMAV